MCKVHDAKTKFHLCKFCGFSAHVERHLREHIAVVHEKRKDWMCTYCGESFASTNQLKHHTEKEHSSLVYTCPQCSKQFKVRRELYRHLQVHQAIRPHKCTLCDQRSFKKYGLKVHLKSQHGVSDEDIDKHILTDETLLDECKSLAMEQLKEVAPIHEVNC